MRHAWSCTLPTTPKKLLHCQCCYSTYAMRLLMLRSTFGAHAHFRYNTCIRIASAPSCTVLRTRQKLSSCCTRMPSATLCLRQRTWQKKGMTMCSYSQVACGASLRATQTIAMDTCQPRLLPAPLPAMPRERRARRKPRPRRRRARRCRVLPAGSVQRHGVHPRTRPRVSPTHFFFAEQ